MNSRCSQCGYMHPPVSGPCPLAEEKKINQEVDEIGNEKAVKLMQVIQRKLVDKLKTLPEDEQTRLSMEVFRLIEKF